MEKKANIVSDILTQQGIPVSADVKTGFYNSDEISLITAFLKVLDNPYDDISLASVLYSIIGKFTLDDLVKLRKGTTNESLINSLNKYVENKESAFAGKERKDFGGFTNEEITDIMNNPDDISKYFGGKYASDILSGGKHLYSERTDREDLKEHHEKVVKQYKEIIESDEEIKKFIEDSKTLKKFLLNDDGSVNDENLEKISDNLIRVEQNYINKKKKKSFFSKIKSWFTGDKEEDDKVDPKELASLAFKLASKRIKLKKQKVEEGLEEYEDFTILEANLEIIESYINDTIVYEDFTNDEPDDLLR